MSTLATFYLRRWLRIFPMLATAIAITIISNQISLGINGGKGFSQYTFASGVQCTNISEVWPMLFFVNNYFGTFYCMLWA